MLMFQKRPDCFGLHEDSVFQYFQHFTNRNTASQRLKFSEHCFISFSMEFFTSPSVMQSISEYQYLRLSFYSAEFFTGYCQKVKMVTVMVELKCHPVFMCIVQYIFGSYLVTILANLCLHQAKVELQGSTLSFQLLILKLV